jgi:hypothetical protein
MADERVEREEKPKKLFTVVHTIWDDGEVDTELYQFRKNQSGRGAPGKWRLLPKEFKNCIEDTLGAAEEFGEIMQENTGIFATDVADAMQATGGAAPIKPLRPPRGFTPDKNEVAELDKGAGETPADEPVEDVDFGEFDKEA